MTLRASRYRAFSRRWAFCPQERERADCDEQPTHERHPPAQHLEDTPGGHQDHAGDQPNPAREEEQGEAASNRRTPRPRHGIPEQVQNKRTQADVGEYANYHGRQRHGADPFPASQLPSCRDRIAASVSPQMSRGTFCNRERSEWRRADTICIRANTPMQRRKRRWTGTGGKRSVAADIPKHRRDEKRDTLLHWKLKRAFTTPELRCGLDAASDFKRHLGEIFIMKIDYICDLKINNLLHVLVVIYALGGVFNSVQASEREIIQDVGNWTILRSTDSMTDKISCMAALKKGAEVQLVSNVMFVGVSGGPRSFLFRIDDKPSSDTILVDAISARIGAIRLNGSIFDDISKGKRLRLQVLTAREVANMDLNIEGISEALKIMETSQRCHT